MYTKHILDSTIIANIEECFIRMQCVIEAFNVYSNRFDLIINSCTALNFCYFDQKLVKYHHHRVEHLA